MTTGMSRRIGSSLQLGEHLVAVELGHQHVEQDQVEMVAPQQVERLAPVLREDDRVALLLQAAAEQEPIHPIVVGDQDRARRRRGRRHETASERSATRASSSGRYASSIRRRARDVPSSSRSFRPLLELPAELGEAGRAEGLAVRLERVGRAPQLLRVAALARLSERRDERRGVREERVDDLGEELLAAELSEAVERARVEAGPGAVRRPGTVGSRDRAHAASASASSSGRIGFAT